MWAIRNALQASEIFWWNNQKVTECHIMFSYMNINDNLGDYKWKINYDWHDTKQTEKPCFNESLQAEKALVVLLQQLYKDQLQQENSLKIKIHSWVSSREIQR